MPSHEHTKCYKNVIPFQPERGKKLKERTKSALEIATGSSLAGCCTRCQEQVKWKVKYGKFKMMAQARRCNGCHLLVVKAAYHNMCRGACGKLLRTRAPRLSQVPDRSRHRASLRRRGRGSSRRAGRPAGQHARARAPRSQARAGEGPACVVRCYARRKPRRESSAQRQRRWFHR